jgi:hypothetical protein
MFDPDLSHLPRRYERQTQMRVVELCGITSGCLVDPLALGYYIVGRLSVNAMGPNGAYSFDIDPYLGNMNCKIDGKPCSPKQMEEFLARRQIERGEITIYGSAT